MARLYCEVDYATKSAFAKAVAKGSRPKVFMPGVFAGTPMGGTHEVVGPHADPKWTAKVEVYKRQVVSVLE